MAANLPPEIGKVLEGLFKKGSLSESGDWIEEYVDFIETEAYGIPVQRNILSPNYPSCVK